MFAGRSKALRPRRGPALETVEARDSAAAAAGCAATRQTKRENDGRSDEWMGAAEMQISRDSLAARLPTRFT